MYTYYKKKEITNSAIVERLKTTDARRLEDDRDS